MWIEGASNVSDAVDLQMLWINIITIVACVLTNGVLVYFIIRYRRRGPNDITSRVEHNTILEITWTVIPSIVFVWLFWWGQDVFRQIRTPGEGAQDIIVDAAQWNWKYTYPVGTTGTQPAVSRNDLYLLEGQPVRLVMRSNDVLHSFFVPAFRTKEDVVPYMNTYITFEPKILNGENQQEYQIYCTEYCGKDHSAMLGKAIVMKQEVWEDTMQRLIDESTPTAENGEKLYNNVCKACHSLDGSVVLGPTFQGLWGKERVFVDGTTAVADENYVENSILNPNSQVVEGFNPVMPAQQLDETEIRSIIEFLKTQQ